MNTSIPTIIFSVHQHDFSAHENVLTNAYAKSFLYHHGIPYFNATGCHKGQREAAFVLQDVADNLDAVRHLAVAYQQESILRIDANRQARLETPQGDLIETLGKFQVTCECSAKKHDAWTKCNGRYWVTA